MKWLRRMLWVVKMAMLIVCLALCALWVRSYWRADLMKHLNAYDGVYCGKANAGDWSTTETLTLVSQWGWLEIFEFRQSERSNRRAAAIYEDKFNEERLRPGWNRGLRQAAADYTPLRLGGDGRWGPLTWRVDLNDDILERHVSRYLSLPHWLLALACGAWPMTSVVLTTRRAVRRRRRARRGLCLSCGYDLRATADGSGGLLPRCPECGRERVASSAAAGAGR